MAHVVLASGTNTTDPKVSLPARVVVLLTSTNIRASVKELSLNNFLFFPPWQTIICWVVSKCESYLRTASWSGFGPVNVLVQLSDNPVAMVVNVDPAFIRTSSICSGRISSWPYGITYFWLLGQVLCEAQPREHSRSYVTGVVTKPSA